MAPGDIMLKNSMNDSQTNSEDRLDTRQNKPDAPCECYGKEKIANAIFDCDTNVSCLDYPMEVMKSPSYFAKVNATGSTKPLPHLNAVGLEFEGCDDTKSVAVGQLAHKAQEFLVETGKFAVANSITARDIEVAVAQAVVFFRQANVTESDAILTPVFNSDNTALAELYIKYAVVAVARFTQLLNTVDRNLITEKMVEGYSQGENFRGTADLIQINEDGTATILDQKHYRQVSTRNLNMFFLQMSIYADLVEQTLGYKVTGLEAILPWQSQTIRRKR